MSDIDSTDPAPALPPPTTSPPSSAVSAPPPGSRRGGAFAWLLLIVIVVVAAYGYWRLQTIEQGHDLSTQSEQAAAQKLHEQADALQRSVEAMRQESSTLRARLDDTAKVNESLRGQVIGLSERARLAEDAIANLAEKRLSGHDALLLNEAELLLVLGGERYTLFADPAPALAAYTLADTALAQANDAAFSSVRQSIGAEIEALKFLQAADLPTLQARLAQLRLSLAQLPVSHRDAVEASPDSTSRWWQIFGQFIRVRRDSELQDQLAHNDPVLARALLDASLRDAQAALLVRDEIRLRHTVTTARAQLAAGFDAMAVETLNAQALFEDLAKATIAPPTPAVLGSALKELRNLRATHALRPDTTPPVPHGPIPTTPEGQS
jgi:uroporphyrin-3 C-methyltransferase